MQRLVFYGKGGIGKSTLAANVSAVLALQGQRVLHVGCDPKHDSTVALMRGEMIPTIVDAGVQEFVSAEQIVRVAPSGVHCVEAGGPEAGVGCAGRGISLTLETLDRAGMLTPAQYDTVVFDLLGDVVCGGFAAPLRQNVGEKVIIVSSEEVMSLYAANNIARAVVNYSANGIVCAGLLLNIRDPEEDLEPPTRLAALLGAEILSVFRRDSLIREAEYKRTTVVEHAPNSPVAAQLRDLAETILAVEPAQCPVPTPLKDREFYALARDRFAGAPSAPRGDSAPRGGPVPPQKAERNAKVDAEQRLRAAFQRDLKEGVAAVSRGLVQPAEALGRLKTAYPELTRNLQIEDLQR